MTSATVSLLPANSTTPIPAQVTAVDALVITFVVPASRAFPSWAPRNFIFKPGNQTTQWTQQFFHRCPRTLFLSGASDRSDPLLAQNINPDGTPEPNGLASPAQPGQGVVLWGTGFGSTPQSAVQITLGGVAQTVLYAGAAPGEPGLNQFNFRIAAGTPDGCYVPLTLTYGTQSVSSFLSKTSDGLPCHHPFQLSVSAMKLLDSGAQLQTGEIALTTGIQAPASGRASRQESAQFLGLYLSASTIANYFIGAATTPAQPCAIGLSVGIVGAVLRGFDSTTLGTMTIQSSTSMLTLPWTPPQPTDSPLNALLAPRHLGRQLDLEHLRRLRSGCFIVRFRSAATCSRLREVHRSRSITARARPSRWNGSRVRFQLLYSSFRLHRSILVLRF